MAKVRKMKIGIDIPIDTKIIIKLSVNEYCLVDAIIPRRIDIENAKSEGSTVISSVGCSRSEITIAIGRESIGDLPKSPEIK